MMNGAFRAIETQLSMLRIVLIPLAAPLWGASSGAEAESTPIDHSPPHATS